MFFFLWRILFYSSGYIFFNFFIIFLLIYFIFFIFLSIYLLLFIFIFFVVELPWFYPTPLIRIIFVTFLYQIGGECRDLLEYFRRRKEKIKTKETF